jgi:hypothetical protein
LQITEQELQQARAIFETDPAMGRSMLAEQMGIKERRARTILDLIRVSRERARVVDTTRPVILPQQEQISQITEHRLKKENRDLREQLKEALEERVLDENYQDFISRVTRQEIKVPDWTVSPRAKGAAHDVIPTLVVSDWHLDEVVRPEECQWKNGYNREIAERRLKNLFVNTIKVANEYIKGFTYPGICMPMIGDMLNGHIHQELKETNVDTTIGSLVYWIGPMAAGIKMLADAFGKVWIPLVVGNHGRNSIKPISKMRARDNFDFLFGQILTQQFAGDKRVSFAISDGHKYMYELYGVRFIVSHGDECRGGSGIAGMLSPLLIAQARMKKTYDFDYWLIGHWHHRAAFRGIRVNGAGKGFDEYAFINNFDFQPPQQDFFLTDARRGVVGEWPIFVQSKDESWVKKEPTPIKQKVAFQAAA